MGQRPPRARWSWAHHRCPDRKAQEPAADWRRGIAHSRGPRTICEAGEVSRYRPARLALLLGGCVVLGLGVGLLLTADLGSDGYSTLVNGISRTTGLSFMICNIG